jgi:hypothetical protein
MGWLVVVCGAGGALAAGRKEFYSAQQIIGSESADSKRERQS